MYQRSMIPALQSEVTDRELMLFQRAKLAVSRVPDDYKPEYHDPDIDAIRCHELARAVAAFLEDDLIYVQDGWFDHMEHTWLWTHTLPTVKERRKIKFPRTPPKILDVYQPGTLPQVVLIHFLGGWALPWRRVYYWQEDFVRKDVDERVVEELLGFMYG